MKFTKTFAQAALAMAYLADRNEPGPTQARQVAEHLGVQTDSALKILQALVRENLLRSQLGRSGGYHLVRPPDEITLLQVIEAIDGPVAPDLPIHAEQDHLATAVQVLRGVCERVADHQRREMARLTVADLAAPGSNGLRLATAS